MSQLTFAYSLIAIILGRLCISVDECIKACKVLMGSIFGSKAYYFPISRTGNVYAQYDSEKVKAAIEKVLRERNPPGDSFFDDEIERRCRVYVLIVLPLNNTNTSSRFVCCVPKDTTNAVRIRSYN